MKRQFLISLLLVPVVACAQDLKLEWTRNFDESKVPAYTLPDPLLCENGHRVTDSEEWERYRRPELLNLVKTYMYGHIPELSHPLGFRVDSLDEAYRFEASGVQKSKSSNSKGAKGKSYTRKIVTVFLTEKGGQGPLAHAEVITPNEADGPVPVFMMLAWSMKHNFPVQRLLDRGYGVAVLNTFEGVADSKDAFTKGLIPAYYSPGQTYRRPDEWGCLAAWGWEASRLLDYLQADPLTDERRVAILGHSRLGKAALWAAVQDERFAMSIPVNSGCGGGALSRRMFGETVWAMNKSFPHWVCDNYQQFNMREQFMPFDQHSVIALMAPRPVYLATGKDDAWADPLGEFLAGKAAEPVYALYGLPGIGCEKQPAVDEAMNQGYIAYHIRTGGHAILQYDWDRFLEYADRFLRR